MSENLDPRAALFLHLVRKARPGITRIEAIANGARYKAALAMSEGWTADEHAAWCTRNRGHALVVHLDPANEPDGVHLILTHDQAERHVTTCPNTVIVAVWGVS